MASRREKTGKEKVKATKKDQREEEPQTNPRAREKEMQSSATIVAVQGIWPEIAGKMRAIQLMDRVQQ